MNEGDFKQRMIGAVVLIALGVIFLPILLNGENDDDMPLFGSNIPERHKSITSMKPLNLGGNIPPPEDKEIETIVVDKLSPQIVSQNRKNVNKENRNKEDRTVLTDTGQKLSQAIPQNVIEAKKLNKIDTTILKATTWVIQVGSFSNKKNALALQNKLRKKKYHAFVEAVTKLSVVSYRVRIGPEVKKKSAETTQKRLKKDMRINGIVMKYKG